MLISAEPSLVSTEEAAFVERATENKFAILEVYLAVVELTRLRIKHFASLEFAVFLLHATDDHQPFEQSIVVFVLALEATETGISDQHFGDFAIIETVRAAVEVNDRAALAGLVIYGFPVAKNSRHLCGESHSCHQQKSNKEKFTCHNDDYFAN